MAILSRYFTGSARIHAARHRACRGERVVLEGRAQCPLQRSLSGVRRDWLEPRAHPGRRQDLRVMLNLASRRGETSPVVRQIREPGQAEERNGFRSHPDVVSAPATGFAADPRLGRRAKRPGCVAVLLKRASGAKGASQWLRRAAEWPLSAALLPSYAWAGDVRLFRRRKT